MQDSFLQSIGWEEFQNSIGNKTFRVDDVLLIKKELKFGKSYFYCPRVSIKGDTNTDEKDIRYSILDIGDFLKKIISLVKKENCIFLRIEPNDKLQVTSYKLQKTNDVQPSQTVILDLDKAEEELLKDMHQKTRYNIRLSEKKGVKIKESDDIEIFWKLTEETTKRDGFRAHDKNSYVNMLQINPSVPLRSTQDDKKEINIKLYLAEYENKVLAAGIFAFYNDTVTYLHGASTHENKNVMAPYALHWEMIKLAKKQGYKYYDFNGIDEKKWPGITRFKKGFGGKEIQYAGTYDVLFNKGWYFIYQTIRKLNRIVRKIF